MNKAKFWDWHGPWFLAFAVALIILAISWNGYRHVKEEERQAEALGCERYRDWTLSSLPAKCLTYFNTPDAAAPSSTAKAAAYYCIDSPMCSDTHHIPMP